MFSGKRIAIGLAIAATVSSISLSQAYAAQNNIFGAVQLNDAVVPPLSLPVENNVQLPNKVDHGTMPAVIKSQKLQDAMTNLENAQADIRKDLSELQSKFTDVDTRYKMVKTERKGVKKQIKAANKRLKDIESAKKKIRNNLK
mgnify:CR=1 FL=1